MTSLIERMAKAAFEAAIEEAVTKGAIVRPKWEDYRGSQEEWQRIIRAALIAARNIPAFGEKWAERLFEAAVLATEPLSYHMSEYHCAGVTWRAIIDEALKRTEHREMLHRDIGLRLIFSDDDGSMIQTWGLESQKDFTGVSG